MIDCKGVSSPGCVEDKNDDEKPESLLYLEPKEATVYRRGVARFNYVALDRPDLSCCAKVVASGMANPTAGDVVRFKRVLRYLKFVRSVKICYKWQDLPKRNSGLGDSDLEGIGRLGKVLRLGSL